MLACQQFVLSLRKDPQDRNPEDFQVIRAYLRSLEALSSLRETPLRALCFTVRYERRDANDILYCRGEFAPCWFILLSGSVFIDGSMFLPCSSFGKRAGGSNRRASECLILEPSEMIAIDYPDAPVSRQSQFHGFRGAQHQHQHQHQHQYHQHQQVPYQNNSGLGTQQQQVQHEHDHHHPSSCSGAQRHKDRESTGMGHHHQHFYHHPMHNYYQQQQQQQLQPQHYYHPHHHHHTASHLHPNSTVDHEQVHVDFQIGKHHLQRNEVLMKSNRSSHSSDTSSAYSGSDTMQSLHSSSLDDQEVDLTGLVESNVDSDEEEDLAESIDCLTVRDTVRECLEKSPQERTEDDIEVLLEFMQHLPAFANMTLSVRRALCAVMVFAVIEKAGTVVMSDGEELDSWSVIVNGHVEVELPDGGLKELHLGDSLGITPTMEKMYHKGMMRTKVDDCQFVCIAQNDYFCILHQGEENTRRHEEDGQVVLVTEHRVLDGGNRRGHVVIKGTPDRLLTQLVEENSAVDPTYVEDFLLAHRTFLASSLKVANQLLTWFTDTQLRDKITRVVLLWVNNHFTDFEMDPEMMEFLEKFEAGLEKEKMCGQLRLLNIACAAKARSRTVTLARSTRDEVLHFSVLGGYERGFGIFISKVEKSSKAEDVGLKRGDQILEVNGQSFEHMSHARSLEVLRGTTHLSITVKSNLLAFKEMLSTPENSPRSRSRKTSEISRLQADPRARLSTHVELIEPQANVVTSSTCGSTQKPDKDKKDKDDRKGFMTLGHKTKLKKALMKMNIIPKAINSETHLNNSDDNLYSGGHHGGPAGCVSAAVTQSPYHTGSMYHSHSNPDLSSLQLCWESELRPEHPEHVLKVFKSDQTCKYLLVHKETTAREVVMLSLREFGITDPSSIYSLCEVTVGEGGVIKQRRLPDQLQNLAERIGLSSRYYLKNNNSTETLVPDILASELMRESQVHFLHLNSVELAVQLTLEDFSILRQIEPTEFIDDLFGLKSKYGIPQLSLFAELVNKEMFWVVTEVCCEHNLVRRMKIIKHFIKVARQCKECKNFNSMFAIISGLGHGAVTRLRNTWEKLPTKYQKMYEDMEDLMDPSRNMSKYRNLINSEHVQPPIIPFYPVMKKDLTFIHLGNDTEVDGLINFEKLRMVAKEIRQLNNMCSAPYDLFTMLELGGAQPSAAMVSMNQLTVGGASLTTFKRRKKSTGLPNPKKMFEESQMVRRVKAYLCNLKIVNNEETLHHMSVECEPLAGPYPMASVQVRKRHPSPTLSTTSSASSTSEGKKSIASVAGPKFGIDSPQAVRKMLALSEPSRIRPHQPLTQPRMPNCNSNLNSNSLSPGPSPHTQRRRTERQCHGRSHSDTMAAPPSVLPVDLSAESSSVTSLNRLPLRKSQTSGSVTSTDSSSVGSLQVHAHNENDSGTYSQLDSHSASSVGSTNSPPSQHWRTVPNHAERQLSHSPPAPRLRTNAPPFPQAVPVLPQVPSSLTLHPIGGPAAMARRVRKPPEYTVAARMARSRQLAKLGRAHSHEGVTSSGYYGSDATDPEDDDDEAQVSAV